MVTIVPLADGHIPFMETIEKASFPVAWGEGSFKKELEDNKLARYLVALDGDEVVGYIGAWAVLDEVHITTFAVDPTRRNQRIGRRLLAALLRNAIDEGGRWTVLEVRESNASAIHLYESFGFRQVGMRKKYYENGENALVLWVGQMQQKTFRDLLATLTDDADASPQDGASEPRSSHS